MAFISWPVRLCSAAACSSSAATSPARGAVKCVAAGKKVTQTLFCSFPLRSLSSLERFCVRHRVSMGGLGELESGVLLYEKNRRALMREMRHSNRGLCATLTTSLPTLME